MYSLILGGLGAIALVILVMVITVQNRTQNVYIQSSAEYQAAVDARIKPISDVYLPGEQNQSSGPTVVAAADPEPAATVMSGPQVYNSACIACHGTGVGGAPKVGDSGSWAPRIAKGIDVLDEHAIHGFTGDSGVMLPKGGRADLSDAEVKDAVQYMVDQSQ